MYLFYGCRPELFSPHLFLANGIVSIAPGMFLLPPFFFICITIQFYKFPFYYFLVFPKYNFQTMLSKVGIVVIFFSHFLFELLSQIDDGVPLALIPLFYLLFYGSEFVSGFTTWSQTQLRLSTQNYASSLPHLSGTYSKNWERLSSTTTANGTQPGLELKHREREKEEQSTGRRRMRRNVDLFSGIMPNYFAVFLAQIYT